MTPSAANGIDKRRISDVSVSTAASAMSMMSISTKGEPAKAPAIVTMDESQPRSKGVLIDTQSDDSSLESSIMSNFSDDKSRYLQKFFSKKRNQEKDLKNDKVKLDMREAFQTSLHKASSDVGDSKLLRRSDFARELNNARAISVMAREMQEAKTVATNSVSGSDTGLIESAQSIHSKDISSIHDDHTIDLSKSSIQSISSAVTLRKIYKHGKHEYERCMKSSETNSPSSYGEMRLGVLHSIEELITNDSYNDFDIVDFMESFETNESSSVYT